MMLQIFYLLKSITGELFLNADVSHPINYNRVGKKIDKRANLTILLATQVLMPL